MKIGFLILLLGSFSEAAQLVIPTTCYVIKQINLVATSNSTLVASANNDVNCWIIQNQDAAKNIYFNVNRQNNNRAHEVQPGTVYQLYTAPFNFLYMSTTSGSADVDLLSGRTQP